MNEIAMRETADIAENVIAKGDLAKLTPAERTKYYVSVCESVGLNPLTQPLAYITLNGKLTLYALKGATDQLRKIHKIAVTDMTEVEREGVIIITVKVQDAEGRTDMAKGAVTINGLKGDALANGIMKAETKAKRRATLSICGLGMLDESEIETIPGATEKPRVRDGSDGRPKSSRQAKLSGDWDFVKDIAAIKTLDELSAWREQHAATIATFPAAWLASFEEVYEAKEAEFAKPAGLSEADSAKVRKVLLTSLHQCSDASEIAEWRDANVTAFRSLTKADQQEVVRERDARLAELFNASGDDERADPETGVLMAG